MSAQLSTPPPTLRPTAKWSQARVDVLRDLWPTTTLPAVIHAALNELPGPFITVHDAGFKASALGLHRPSGMRGAKPAAKPPVQQPEPDWEPFAADFATIADWAAKRGGVFASWDDLPAVNETRDRLGFVPFKRLYPTKGVRG